MEDKGWSCPKCGRVFAPFVQCCNPCNSAIDNREGAKNPKPEKATVAGRTSETRAQFDARHKDDPLCGYGGHYGY